MAPHDKHRGQQHKWQNALGGDGGFTAIDPAIPA